MIAETVQRVKIEIPKPHSQEQASYVRSVALRQMIRAGRRFGKTVGSAIKAEEAFTGTCPACGGDGCSRCSGTGRTTPKRVLYAAPVSEQVDKFWYEVKNAFRFAIELGYLKKDETQHFIERPGTELRLQARTAWNADTLRGGFWDLLILEELQLMDEEVWESVGQPMLIDSNGTAVFIYTPPSLRSGISKSRDPRYAAKLFKKAQLDTTGDWATFHFTSHENPTLSQEALAKMITGMSREAYRREILAEDDELELSWLVYKAFNEAVCKIKRFEIPKNWLVFSGHDFGSANPAALFFAQVKLPLPQGAPPHMRLNDLVCFKEYLPGGMGAPQHVNAFKEICGQWLADKKDWRPVKSVGGNVTTEEQTRQLYGMHGWPISPPTITHVSAQIDRVVGLMELNKIYCFEDNIYWLEELMNCLWELDRDGKPTNKIKDEARYHLSACARYILSGFVPETVTNSRPRVRTSPWAV